METDIEMGITPTSPNIMVGTNVENTGVQQQQHQNGVQLMFRNITYKVKNTKYKKEKKSWFGKKESKPSDDSENADIEQPPKQEDQKPQEKEITILHEVSGIVEPGELVALMGPSGSGKSTLLDILAKRKSSGTITGDLMVNGKVVGEGYKNYISYVTQEDTLLPTSTVRETLKFYADLRLHKYTEVQKNEIIEQVLKDIGLYKKADSKIGGLLPGGIMLRGLSGGEKRRVSIGCGLVTNPSLIFLDEPTSGLDSLNALVVLKTLLDLTKKGVTVICSIHQPRSEIFRLFNKVMVVVKGRMIYSGSDIMEYFQSLGYNCPNNVNPADFCLDTSVEIGESSRYAEICDKWSQHWERELSTNAQPNIATEKKRAKAGKFYQYNILLGRTFKDFLRNPGNFLARTLTAAVVGLLFGACFANVGKDMDQGDIQKVAGVIFFLVSGLNLTPFTSISLFLSGRALFNAERAAKIYHPFPYFMATMTVEFMVVFCVALILSGVTYGISFLRQDFSRFMFAFMVYLFVHALSDLCIIWLTNLTGTSDHTFAYGSGLSVVYQLFSAFFVPANELPISFAWLRWLNPLFYSFTSLMINEFEGRDIKCPEPPMPCLYPTGEDVLKQFGIEDWSRENAFGVVVMFTVLFYVLSYLALAYLHKEKR